MTPRRPHADPYDKAQTHLKVFSSPRIGKLSRRVTITLGAAGRHGLTAKEVALAVSAPLRTVYRVLHRLEESSVVERTKLGTWAASSVLADITTDPTAVLGFENFRIAVSNWQTDPTPPCRMAKTWGEVTDGGSGSRETVELDWEGCRVVLTLLPKDK